MQKKAVERLKNGEDYVAIAQDYGIEPYCSEINSYTGSYSEEMNKIIESLEDNEVSDPIESTLGYNVIYMIKTNDQNMKDSYIYSMVTDGLDEEFEKLRNMWLATIKIDAEGDKIGTVWDDFDLKGLLINMEKAGVIK